MTGGANNDPHTGGNETSSTFRDTRTAQTCRCLWGYGCRSEASAWVLRSRSMSRISRNT